MQTVKVLENGQIKLPKKILKKLNLNIGETLAVIPTENGFYIQNASIAAIDEIRAAMKSEAEKAGLHSEEDVVTLIKEYRKSVNE
jgi:AbrB family looped-hinge helix DNA binding protein